MFLATVDLFFKEGKPRREVVRVAGRCAEPSLQRRIDDAVQVAFENDYTWTRWVVVSYELIPVVPVPTTPVGADDPV